MVDQFIAAAGVKNPRVLHAMRSVPRHLFVPAAGRQAAYQDRSLPIGDGQTISSPFIVAYMTECLDPQPTDRILEIGTGSGYQAAVLSPLVQSVHTIEIVPKLGKRAEQTLRRLGYENVHVRIGDGFAGWPEAAPFDKIIVTCSPEKVPQPLVDQLAEGGRMVIPVGERYQQTIHLLTKKQGALHVEELRPTLFVPMTGQAESKREVRPDPKNPRLINGSFEAAASQDEPGNVPGWYYLRGAERIRGDDAPDGHHYVIFRNDTLGRPSHLMQGLAVDGRTVSRMTLRCWVRTANVRFAPGSDFGPLAVVSFYDENRRDLGQQWVGPWRGTRSWTLAKRQIRVPVRAREAIVRIGLFGATGEAAFDEVRLEREPGAEIGKKY